MLYRAELRKLLQNRFCPACLAALLALNLFLLWVEGRPLPGRPAPAAYRAAGEALRGLDAFSQQSLLQQRLAQARGLYQVEWIASRQAMDPAGGAVLRARNEQLLLDYGPLYAAGDYPLFAASLAQEVALLTELEQECSQVAGYEAFLDEIAGKAQTLSQISIFSLEGADGYARQNIRRTALAYEGMRGRPIEYAPQRGLMTALGFWWTDLLILAAILALAAALVRTERDSGMLALIRSTPCGRLKTALAKLGVLAAGLLAVLLLLYGCNLACCEALYGLGGLGRSIQSVPALMRSTLKVSVAQYLVLFLLSKWAAAFVLGAWVLLACLAARHTLAGYLAALAFPAGCLLLRAAIPATGKLNVLKYANLASLLKNNELLGGYRNLYWFGRPVQLAAVELAAALLYGGGFVLAFCLLFARARLAAPRRKAAAARPGRPRKHGRTLAAQERYKLFILGGAGAVLAAFAGLQLCRAAATENFIGPQEIYFARYMERLAGPVTGEKLEWLQSEGERFRPFSQTGGPGGQPAAPVNYSLQQEYAAYQQVVSRFYYLRARPGAHFVYDTGYPLLLGHTGQADLQEQVLSGFVIALCCSAAFAAEHATGMQRVVRATPLGGRRTFWLKLRLCCNTAAAAVLLALAPRLWQVGSGYGFGGLTAPLYSLPQYPRASRNIPVFMLLFTALAARLIAGWIMAVVTAALSHRLKNTLAALLLSTALFCLSGGVFFFILKV